MMLAPFSRALVGCTTKVYLGAEADIVMKSLCSLGHFECYGDFATVVLPAYPDADAVNMLLECGT
jgi:hypothetical protein